jgi:hypothetical protein
MHNVPPNLQMRIRCFGLDAVTPRSTPYLNRQPVPVRKHVRGARRRGTVTFHRHAWVPPERARVLVEAGEAQYVFFSPGGL